MVTIRPFDQKNIALHFKWNKEKDRNYLFGNNGAGAKSFQSFIYQVKAELDEQNSEARLFEIHLAKNNRLIGAVHIHHIDTASRTCVVDCNLGDEECNTTEHRLDALRQMIGFCFQELGMEKVMTTAFDYGNGWEQAVQKLGFSLDEYKAGKNGKEISESCFGLDLEQYQNTSKDAEAPAV